MSLTKERIIQEAAEIGCDPAALIAVDTVESGGSGFLHNGEPMILFEPHVFWKELRERGFNPNNILKKDAHKNDGDILYPKWGSRAYGSIAEQHHRLQRAIEIHREAALCSASWGRYQILARNWKQCNCDSLQEFINKMYKSEDEHLDCFTTFVKTNHLDDELRGHDWAGFAAGYNGSLYRKNGYDVKLDMAYKKAKLAGW